MRFGTKKIAGVAAAVCLSTALSAGVAQAAEGNATTKTGLSSAVGSSDLEGWYEQSPATGKVILSFLMGAVVLEGIGMILGPMRSFVAVV